MVRTSPFHGDDTGSIPVRDIQLRSGEAVAKPLSRDTMWCSVSSNYGFASDTAMPLT